MAQFGLDPRDAFSLLRVIASFLPLRWQRTLFVVGLMLGAAGWFFGVLSIELPGIALILLSLLSRILMRIALLSFGSWLAPLIAAKYAGDRVLHSQLYFDQRDHLSIFIVEESSLRSTEHWIEFRPRLLRLGRSAFEVPISTTNQGLQLDHEWHGLEWNPGGRQAYLHELTSEQRKGLWNNAARVYALPLGEIIGVGIPGGGTGLRSIHIDLLDVLSGESYRGSITIWRDWGAPIATLRVAPYNPKAAVIAMKIAARFGMRTSKSALSQQSHQWRVKHGRNAKNGLTELRWVREKRLARSLDEKEVIQLGRYRIVALFKGPILLVDGDRLAVVYLPISPYEHGKLEQLGGGKVLWKSKDRDVSFEMLPKGITFEVVRETRAEETDTEPRS